MAVCLGAKAQPRKETPKEKSPLEKFVYNNCYKGTCRYFEQNGGKCTITTAEGREIMKLCILAAQTEVPDFAKFMAQAMPIETGIIQEIEKATVTDKKLNLSRKCPVDPATRICFDVPTTDCLAFKTGCPEREQFLEGYKKLTALKW